MSEGTRFNPFLWIIGLVAACVLGSVVGVAIGGAGPSDDDVRSKVRDGIVLNCETDRKFRVQYRQRAIIERRVIQIEVTANDALIDVAEEAAAGAPRASSIQKLDDILDTLNTKLDRLRDRIKVIPVPECSEIRNAVESLDGS